ncbi:putative Ig domain-containing protein, partial [Hydrogenophaga sp. 5NK40-0174]|uniref:putative Ig domain-containing protein n=1 Tax=Hydrogenophaga sp. 5NK40-0174 TaxID=3127649 RepID=UPI0033411C8F
PTLVGGGQPSDQTGQDGQSITPLDVTGAFDDPDGDTLTYSVSGLPAGLSINPATGIASGTLTSNASQGGPGGNGVYNVTVTATDGSGATASTTFTYTVTNPPPNAVDDSFTVSEDAASGVIGSAVTNDSDPDGDSLSGVVQTNTPGTGGGLFNISLGGSVTFNPNGAFESLGAGETATTSMTYQVTDGQGGFDTATITVTVNGVNDAPDLVGGAQPANQAGVDGQGITPIDVSGAFSDVEGDTLTYSASGLPAGLSINPATGEISGTLDTSASQGGSAGVHTVSVTATDPGGLTATTTFT